MTKIHKIASVKIRILAKISVRSTLTNQKTIANNYYVWLRSSVITRDLSRSARMCPQSEAQWTQLNRCFHLEWPRLLRIGLRDPQALQVLSIGSECNQKTSYQEFLVLGDLAYSYLVNFQHLIWFRLGVWSFSSNSVTRENLVFMKSTSKGKFLVKGSMLQFGPVTNALIQDRLMTRHHCLQPSYKKISISPKSMRWKLCVMMTKKRYLLIKRSLKFWVNFITRISCAQSKCFTMSSGRSSIKSLSLSMVPRSWMKLPVKELIKSKTLNRYTNKSSRA